jgi:hypothetical protein
MANDSLKQCIAELTGIKEKELKPEQSESAVRSWMAHLAEHGFKVQARFVSDKPADRHIVLYSDPKGELQAVLSDSDAAKHVKPISRLVITKDSKTAKTGDGAKAGERQEA